MRRLTGDLGLDAAHLVTHRDMSRDQCIDAAEELTGEIEPGFET